MSDKVEFHLEGRVISEADSSHASDRGDLVNIRKTTYRVIGKTYTLDHADESLAVYGMCHQFGANVGVITLPDIKYSFTRTYI